METKVTPLCRIESICLQIGHRLAIVALLATVAGWGMLVDAKFDTARLDLFKSYRQIMPFAFFAGDLALCVGIAAAALAQRNGRSTAEAKGIILFGSSLVLLSLPVLLLSGLGLMIL